jgi:MtrB/PioB family decaheme-associated outer membrane protein
MTQFDSSTRFHRTALALALCAAFIPAQAQEKSVDTTVSVGLGAIDGSSADRALFGQYNGLHNGKAGYATLGIDYSLRDQENSNWIQVLGTDLLGDTRELSAVWKNPGSWKLSANYGELVHSDPNTVNTGLIGAGSTAPQVVVLPGGPGTGGNLNLSTKRTGLGLGFTSYISPALRFDVSMKREDKEGARLAGIGMNCPSLIAPNCLGTAGANTNWATLLVPEPIKSNQTQVEARLGYAIEKFRISLGYYGSFYRNAYGSLTPSVPSSLNNAEGSLLPLNGGLQSILSQPVALPPDNQAHQFDLTGGYDFTHSTRATFKLGYTTATQNANFAGAGFSNAPAGVTSLGGLVNTTLAKIGLTSRPMQQLSLLADARYEDRDDQTPLALYNIEGPTTPTYTNRNLPNRKTKGKLLATWQFTSDYRGSVGADYEGIDRGVFTPSSAVSGISALRQKTAESGVNAELRRRMSDEFSGAISVSSSSRTGSNWLKDNSGLGVTEVTNTSDPVTGLSSTSIFMPTLADRHRDKAKLFGDWAPTEALALQFSVETGSDQYTTPSAYGLRSTRMNQVSVDASYALSDNWALTSFASWGTQGLNQVRPAGSVLAFDDTNIGIGVGVTGKVSGKLVVGGNLAYNDDKSVYAQTLDSLAGSDSAALLAATGGLPNIVFRQASLKLFGKYELDKASALRVDLVYQHASVSDWAWGYGGVPYTYSDGTTVSQKPSQGVGVIGVMYVYKLQ